MFFLNRTEILWRALDEGASVSSAGFYKWKELEILLRSVNPVFQDEGTKRTEKRQMKLLPCSNLVAFTKHLTTFASAVVNRDIRKIEAASVGWVNVDDKRDGIPILCAAILEDHPRIADWLIKNGADVNVMDKYYRTPLECAICRGHDDITKQLIKYGADINVGNCHGNTPLHSAVLSRNLFALKQLINAGANVNQGNVDGFTPLFISVMGNFYEMTKMLLNSGANVNLPITTGVTPLMEAVGKHNYKMVDLLVRYGANVDPVDKDGVTPLIRFAKQGMRCNCLRDLLKFGAAVNHMDAEGNTALHYAVRAMDLDSMKVLLTYGANPMFKNEDGETPYDWVNFLDCDGKEKNQMLRLLNKYVSKCTSLAPKSYYGVNCHPASRVAQQPRLSHESQRYLGYSRDS